MATHRISLAAGEAVTVHEGPRGCTMAIGPENVTLDAGEVGRLVDLLVAVQGRLILAAARRAGPS